jgi:nucleotidyltransferase/DNA polymerase involved in DNA repair
MLGGKRGSKMKREATKSKSLKQLQTIRNIGIVTAKRLYSIGIETPEQLKKSDPRELYERLKTKEGGKLDRCVLYQLRGAVLDIPWPECKSLHNG